MSRFRASYWVYLTLISLLTLTVTVTAVTLTWRNNTWRLINRFDKQVGRQVVAILNEKLNNLLEAAPHQTQINLELLEDRIGVLEPEDFRGLSEYWVDVMRIHENLSYLSISFEADGRMLMVSRNAEKEIHVAELRRNEGTGKLELHEFLPQDYPERPFRVDPDRDYGDPRNREWYRQAKEAGRPIWSDVYVFIGSGNAPNVPGVTYAAPFFRTDGSLLGVLTADIDLLSLCNYFQENRRINQELVERGELSTAFAFIANQEQPAAGHVIAYHDVTKIMRPSKNDPKGFELIPGDELTESGLRGFYDNVIQTDFEVPLHEPVNIEYVHDGIVYKGFIQRLQGKDMPEWLIGVAIEESEYLQWIFDILKETVTWGFFCLVAAILFSIYLARRVTNPLATLAREAQEIGRGNLAPAELRTNPIREVDSLFRAKEEMKRGLRSFQKYVPKEIVNELLLSGQEAELGGRRSRLTVLFADLVDFTSLAERMEPEQVVDLLSRFHGVMSTTIVQNRGTLDKYIGDAVMAFWGAPSPNPEHAYLACITALEAQEKLSLLRAEQEASGHPPTRCRIGINTGDSVVGNMGIPSRLSYTAIGDSVNLASRLEGLNRYYGTEILAAEETIREVGDRLVARRLDRVFVKGKSQGVYVYQLVGRNGEVSEETVDFIHRYESALALYQNRQWTEALVILDDLQARDTADLATALLRERCLDFSANPPGADWDGVHRVG